MIGTYDGTIKTARSVRQTVPQGMGFLLLKETVMTGVLPSQDLKTMIKEGVINAQPQIIAEQIQATQYERILNNTNLTSYNNMNQFETIRNS